MSVIYRLGIRCAGIFICRLPRANGIGRVGLVLAGDENGLRPTFPFLFSCLFTGFVAKQAFTFVRFFRVLPWQKSKPITATTLAASLAWFICIRCADVF
ncbi:hypothetical protein [Vogesella fluminis]|nr:hypothetical protein [Vogesella fluminis]